MPIIKKLIAILFKLLPSKVYHVPLYVAYNCKIYVTPDVYDIYKPALVFDVRGYNLRLNDISEITCKRILNNEYLFIFKFSFFNIK